MSIQNAPDGLAYLNELAMQDPEYGPTAAVFDTVQAVCAGLKRMRLRRGFGQGELGRILGVSQGRISQIESGLVDHAPSLDMVARYAAVCGERLEIGFSGDAKSR